MTLITKKAKWENEKNSVNRLQELRGKVESVKKEIEMAQNEYNLDKAAQLQYGTYLNFRSS